jgi:hypothetical protein
MLITDIFKDTIEITDERWRHIMREHPEVESYKKVLQGIVWSTTPLWQRGVRGDFVKNASIQ